MIVKQRILLPVSVFDPEPVTSALLNLDLAYALAEKYDVTVVRPYPSRPVGADYSNYKAKYPFKCITVETYRCPESKLFGRMRESISFGLACARYIEKHHNEIDCILNGGWQLFGYYIIARTCVKFNIPYIVPIQDIYPETLFTNKHYPKYVEGLITAILLPIDKYYQRHAFKVRTISDEMADYMSRTRKVSRENYVVYDNWQNEEDFIYEPLINEKIVFGYVGSINGHSNTELIIKAFFEAHIENCELRIYGGGNHKDACEKIVKDLGIQNVKFDLVDKKHVPEVQKKCSVLVLALPTGNGGLCLPSKMTSYMLSGRAILASVERSATTRYIAEADCGITVEPDNVLVLAEAFRQFATMSLDELNRLGKNSRTFAERKLTRSSNLPILLKAFADALSNTTNKLK